METLDLGGTQFTVQALEKLITMLQQHGEVTIKNVAPETPSLLTLGATLARWAENERTPLPYQMDQATKHLFSSFCVCGESKQRLRPFCLSCYDKLPDEVKRKIGLMLKDKFVNGYLAGWQYLKAQLDAKPYQGEMMSGIAKTSDAVIERHKTA